MAVPATLDKFKELKQDLLDLIEPTRRHIISVSDASLIETTIDQCLQEQLEYYGLRSIKPICINYETLLKYFRIIHRLCTESIERVLEIEEFNSLHKSIELLIIYHRQMILDGIYRNIQRTNQFIEPSREQISHIISDYSRNRTISDEITEMPYSVGEPTSHEIHYPNTNQPDNSWIES
jgi:hypothetical protein